MLTIFFPSELLPRFHGSGLPDIVSCVSLKSFFYCWSPNYIYNIVNAQCATIFSSQISVFLNRLSICTCTQCTITWQFPQVEVPQWRHSVPGTLKNWAKLSMHCINQCIYEHCFFAVFAQSSCQPTYDSLNILLCIVLVQMFLFATIFALVNWNKKNLWWIHKTSEK